MGVRPAFFIDSTTYTIFFGGAQGPDGAQGLPPPKKIEAKSSEVRTGAIAPLLAGLFFVSFEAFLERFLTHLFFIIFCYIWGPWAPQIQGVI